MVKYEVVIPRYSNTGIHFKLNLHKATQEELIEKFGGLTVIPVGGGYWAKAGKIVKDEVMMYIVVGSECDKWMSNYKARLEDRYQQDVVFIIRSEVSIM